MLRSVVFPLCLALTKSCEGEVPGGSFKLVGQRDEIWGFEYVICTWEWLCCYV